MVRHEHSRRVARNHVKAQWPKTGSVLPTNGKAVLTVSKGQPPKRRK
jgi:beta-lactam-binding protein with PASTA domain